MTVSYRLDVEAAAEDLKNHSLRGFREEISRLVYLAGTRDYNTGKYYHDGLALRYTSEVACKALAFCHEESFRKVLEISLEDLVAQLQEYLSIHDCEGGEVLKNWSKLEVYRVIVPSVCDLLSASFFCSNLRLALAILESRMRGRPSS